MQTAPHTELSPFASFLTQKKVNAAAFEAQSLQEYTRLQIEFDALGQKAFIQRKLFFINDLRLRFPLLANDA